MTLTEPRPASTLRVVLNYFGALILGIVVYFVIVWIAEEYFNLQPSSNAMGIILVVIASVTAGSGLYTREQARPTSGRLWRLAIICAVATVILQTGIIALAAANTGDELIGQIRNETPSTIAIFVAVVAVVDALLIRLGLWLGVRQGVKIEVAKALKAEKQALKADKKGR